MHTTPYNMFSLMALMIQTISINQLLSAAVLVTALIINIIRIYKDVQNNS